MDEDGYKAFQDQVTAKSKPIVYVLQKADTSKVAAMVSHNFFSLRSY